MIGFPGNACSLAFNALVPGIVAAHKAKGMKIYYTPMAETSGVCQDKSKDTSLFPVSGLCCQGQVHPTSAGYRVTHVTLHHPITCVRAAPAAPTTHSRTLNPWAANAPVHRVLHSRC
jgi:hypothetical protein